MSSTAASHPVAAGHRGRRGRRRGGRRPSAVFIGHARLLAPLQRPRGTGLRPSAAPPPHARRVAGTGVVSVVHGELRTTYLPVAPVVARGDTVAAGATIGTLADDPPHCPGRPCLHWGLRRGADYLDPMALLGTGEIRLLPRPG